MTECFKTTRTANEVLALALWGDQGNPLNFIVESNSSVGYTSQVCERCGKKFAFYRKRNIVYNKKSNHFKQVCVDCISLTGDVF